MLWEDLEVNEDGSEKLDRDEIWASREVTPGVGREGVPHVGK